MMSSAAEGEQQSRNIFGFEPIIMSTEFQKGAQSASQQLHTDQSESHEATASAHEQPADQQEQVATQRPSIDQSHEAAARATQQQPAAQQEQTATQERTFYT